MRLLGLPHVISVHFPLHYTITVEEKKGNITTIPNQKINGCNIPLGPIQLPTKCALLFPYLRTRKKQTSDLMAMTGNNVIAPAWGITKTLFSGLPRSPSTI